MLLTSMSAKYASSWVGLRDGGVSDMTQVYGATIRSLLLRIRSNDMI
jgi:hypothetical protein